MKKLIIIFLFSFPLFSFAQASYIYRDGGKIFQNGKKISPDKVRILLIEDQKTLEIYNAGRSKKTFGNILLYGGIALIVGNGINNSPNAESNTQNYSGQNSTGNNTQKKIVRAPYYIGLAMVAIAIPIKFGYSKKIQQTVQLMNQNLRNPKTVFIESTSIMVNNDGIGMSFTF